MPDHRMTADALALLRAMTASRSLQPSLNEISVSSEVDPSAKVPRGTGPHL